MYVCVSVFFFFFGCLEENTSEKNHEVQHNFICDVCSFMPLQRTWWRDSERKHSWWCSYGDKFESVLMYVLFYLLLLLLLLWLSPGYVVFVWSLVFSFQLTYFIRMEELALTWVEFDMYEWSLFSLAAQIPKSQSIFLVLGLDKCLFKLSWNSEWNSRGRLFGPIVHS